MMGMINKNNNKIKCPICNGLNDVSAPLTIESISQQLITNRAALPGNQEEEKKGPAVPILEPEVYEAEERLATEDYEKLIGTINKSTHSHCYGIHFIIFIPFFGAIGTRIASVF